MNFEYMASALARTSDLPYANYTTLKAYVKEKGIHGLQTLSRLSPDTPDRAMFKQYGKAMLALRELASFSVPKEQLAINDEQFNMKPIKLPVGPENLHTVKKRDKVKPEVTVSFDKVSPFEVACLYSPSMHIYI